MLSATGINIASGDRVAADVVGLGLIRSFNRWRLVWKEAFGSSARSGMHSYSVSARVKETYVY